MPGKFEVKKKERGENKTTPANKQGGTSPAARNHVPKMKDARPKDFLTSRSRLGLSNE